MTGARLWSSQVSNQRVSGRREGSRLLHVAQMLLKGERGGKSYLFGGEEGRRGGDSYKAIRTHIRYFQLCRIGPRVRKQENRQARAGRETEDFLELFTDTKDRPNTEQEARKKAHKPSNYPSVSHTHAHTHSIRFSLIRSHMAVSVL